MISGIAIRENQYYDSLFLMGVNNRLSKIEGVEQIATLMGSENNKKLLSDIGINDKKITSARANDLILGVLAKSQETIDKVIGQLDEALMAVVETKEASQLHTFDDALLRTPDANMAVLSIPGEYVYREARQALESGLNVFVFSSNVSIEEERNLKKLAYQKNLLLMGPDCGTSIIGGVGIGFSNSVRRGTIGVVGPSGTGLQEFTSQIHNAGLGISHAIGTGGRDLKNEIGAITTLQAMELLEADDESKLIAIIAKPPDREIINLLLSSARNFSKPVICCFLGAPIESNSDDENIVWGRTIDDAVLLTLQFQEGKNSTAPRAKLSNAELELATQLAKEWSPAQKYIRGLFSGGTFCYQSQQIFGDAGIEVNSNTPLATNKKLENPKISVQHSFVDLGDEEFTLGRPHPMIDGSTRKARILSESGDSSVGALLIDFVLGYNASMDPVGDVLDAILEGKKKASENGSQLTVVASVCGTDQDPQDLKLQRKLLADEGVIVFNSNARAAMFCRALTLANREA